MSAGEHRCPQMQREEMEGMEGLGLCLQQEVYLSCASVEGPLDQAPCQYMS